MHACIVVCCSANERLAPIATSIRSILSPRVELKLRSGASALVNEMIRGSKYNLSRRPWLCLLGLLVGHRPDGKAACIIY
nr:hypothetical protein Q903MT_gene2348 [Picea sitchensis]